MKKFIIVTALLIPTLSYAQEQEFNLKVNAADIQLLGEALGELPFKKSAPLMQKLQVQINTIQQQSPKPAVEVPKPKTEGAKP